VDLPEPSTELAQLRAEVENLRLDLNRIESLTRQLDGARDELRRSTEGIERRDVIIREARKQIATLSRKLDEARREAYEAQKALHHARGTRWFALREAVRRARKRPWRWLFVPFTLLRPRRENLPPEPVAPVSAWEPPAAQPSRPVAPRSPRSLRIAGVVGAALRAQLDPECSLFTFGPGDWAATLEDARPHLLLVESDIFANDGSWQGELGEGAAGDELRRLVAWCRAQEIPTAFWNTADPVGFDRWLSLAALFDNVFTVDSDAVARYAARGAIATANVTALPPCVQPRAFGSTSAGRTARACFVLTAEHASDARAWSETRAVLTAAKELIDVYAVPGLVIPEGLPVAARELAEPLSSLFRRYAVSLSTSAHGDAKGKIPQRVLEMLASGIAVAAPASADVSLHLAPVVETFDAPDAGTAALQKLLDNEAGRAQLASQGELLVLRSHTSMDRLGRRHQGRRRRGAARRGTRTGRNGR
jgi:hypothetical protein